MDKLEHRSRMICAGVPSFFGLGLEVGHAPTSWLLLYSLCEPPCMARAPQDKVHGYQPEEHMHKVNLRNLHGQLFEGLKWFVLHCRICIIRSGGSIGRRRGIEAA